MKLHNYSSGSDMHEPSESIVSGLLDDFRLGKLTQAQTEEALVELIATHCYVITGTNYNNVVEPALRDQFPEYYDNER